MNIGPFIAAIMLLPLTGTTARAAEPQTGLPEIVLRIKQHEFFSEVAATSQTREIGLMHRFSLRQDHGMLFVFPSPQVVAMWMKNTFVPLSVAFIDPSGSIINIEDMRPQALTTHESAGPALYALEMRQGWFKERGIGPGDAVEGLAKAPKAAR